jgi:gliding motility-associated-like protein
LGSDTSICVGHTIEFNGSTNGFYLWQDGSTNPNFVTSDSGTYYVTVSNMCGSATDSITLRIDPCEKIIFVPNAFSPDNDGINDVFKPYSDYLNQYEMWIYNRWGELIFYTNDVNEAWDGYHNGKEAQMGVYVWKIVYKDYYDKTYTQIGNVVLIR